VSNTGKTRSKENKAAELEPDNTSEIELEETITYLEPKTERTAEAEIFKKQKTILKYTDQKTLRRKLSQPWVVRV